MVHTIKMYAILIAFLLCLSLGLGAASPAAETAVEGINDAITATMATTETVLAVFLARRGEASEPPDITEVPKLGNSTDTGSSGHHNGRARWTVWGLSLMLFFSCLAIVGCLACVLWPAIRLDYNCRAIIEGARNALNRCRRRRRPGPVAEAEPEVELDWLEGEVPTVPPPAYTARV
ncbi:hypothetical protein N7493_011982 [Penicillium malachiteum]|uniref:Uncharacterized protein n=1 Tax=Penicillium malachiteum TaxID=1324776 RepID=A0AAD6HA13_9EURO|nr:hypothetical protein N7493_011982 [Penicillium malachiteum]